MVQNHFPFKRKNAFTVLMLFVFFPIIFQDVVAYDSLNNLISRQKNTPHPGDQNIHQGSLKNLVGKKLSIPGEDVTIEEILGSLPESEKTLKPPEILEWKVDRQKFEATIHWPPFGSKILVRGRWTQRCNVPVLIKRVTAHEPILPHHIGWQSITSQEMTDDTIQDVKEILGHHISHVHVTLHRPLKTHEIRRPLLIKKGEVVYVWVRQRGLQLRTRGQALENGYLDKMIPVLNIDTKKQILGRVMAPQHVMVDDGIGEG